MKNNWLESLSPPQTPADLPGPIIAALRRRRQARLAVRLSAAGALAALALATYISWPSPEPRLDAPSPIAVDTPEVRPFEPEAQPLTLAAMYLPGGPSLDDLPPGGSGAVDQALTIGDHWDPERVEAWMLD